jgi:UDP-glucose 4-epimerase|tara:strand:+ start:2382 stop:3278 length:897 start_codon:yes stop_codon:yes gene_type:complete
MRILITGAGGFLGKNLVPVLNNKNHDVIVTGNNEGFLEYFKNKKVKNVTVKKLDVTNLKECISLIKEVDVVIHLAAIIDVSFSLKHPKEVMKVNFNGTFNVLEAMRINKIKKIIFLSSQDVYGNNTNSKEENLDKITPLNAYSLSKFLSENLIRSYSFSHNINYIIFRPSHLYGKDQEKGIIPMLQSKVSKNDIVEIGNNVKRDFLNVYDLINAIVLGLDYKGRDIFNVGTGASTSLKEVLTIISKAKNKDIKIVENKALMRDYKLERWDEIANIGKIKNMGFKTKWKIKEWIKENLS